MHGLRYAIGAKGAGKTVKRFLIIARAYGITPKRMERFANCLESVLAEARTKSPIVRIAQLR